MNNHNLKKSLQTMSGEEYNVHISSSGSWQSEMSTSDRSSPSSSGSSSSASLAAPAESNTHQLDTEVSSISCIFKIYLQIYSFHNYICMQGKPSKKIKSVDFFHTSQNLSRYTCPLILYIWLHKLKMKSHSHSKIDISDDKWGESKCLPANSDGSDRK